MEPDYQNDFFLEIPLAIIKLFDTDAAVCVKFHFTLESRRSRVLIYQVGCTEWLDLNLLDDHLSKQRNGQNLQGWQIFFTT